MKKYRYYFTILFFAGLLGSCKKSFLDVENNTNLFRQTYVRDLATMEQFMNGIYVLMNTSYEWGMTSAYPDLVADNLKPLAPPSTQALLAHYSWTQKATEARDTRATETSTSMNGVWKTGYQVIRACDFVIEDIEKYRSENPSKADDIQGQALAVRALVHFRLVNIFAQTYQFSVDASHPGIPYITTSDISKPYKRQTVGEVYNAMINDLNNAIQLFSSVVTDVRFMNRAAAKALLARIYLFKEDYAKAKNVALEVCTQFPLMTISSGYPVDIFKNKVPSQTEVLFQLTPVNISTGSFFVGVFCRDVYLRYTATNDIAAILKENPNDIRSGWVNSSNSLWKVVKFPTGVATGLTPAPALTETAYYSPVLRSSEMFLTVAEAAAKTGDENTARTYVDAIRIRANPTLPSITASGTALIDSIYKERRKELCFEGLRMQDLQRWKLGVHRVDVLPGVAKDLAYPNDKAISPIHLSDVQMEGLQQNTGY